MNQQNPFSDPSKFPVKIPIVKKILIRMIIRNIPSQTQRFFARQKLEKDFETLNRAPEVHLAAAFTAIGKAAEKGKNPDFEIGVLFGVSMTLASRSVNGNQMLSKFLADVEAEQNASEPDPEEDKAEEKVEDPQLPTETAFPDSEVTP